MTVYVKVVNDAGKLMLLDDNLVPWFLGKATHTGTGAWTNSGGAYDRQILTYSIPAGSGRLIAATLPVDADEGWYAVEPYVGGGTALAISVLRPAGSTENFAAPEVYVFETVNSPPASSGIYGMRLRNVAGNIILDTGSPPISVKKIGAFAFGVTGASFSGLPAKPAFILPAYAKFELEDTSPTTSDLDDYVGGWRRPTSTTISSAVLHQHAEGVDAGYDETLEFGTTTTQAVVVIDAANYD
jgi:hypothetical protein